MSGSTYAVSKRIPSPCRIIALHDEAEDFQENRQGDGWEWIRVRLHHPSLRMPTRQDKQSVQQFLIVPTQPSAEFAEFRFDPIDDVRKGIDALAHPAPSAIGRPWQPWLETA